VLELRHLRYFLAVAEELNFSRAAERLNMAQPPLSVAIRQLEQELGTPLFTRTTRDVRLTNAGELFLDGARATLAELDRAVLEARRASQGELGRMRVAFSWGARFVTLPALGQAFRAGHPDVEVLTEEMWNARMPAALKSRSIDLAISVCAELDGDLRYDTIRSEPVSVLVPEDHPLAGESHTELAALKDDAFIMFPRELAPRLYEKLVGICRGAGFEPAIRAESFHSSWDLGMAAAVPGVALVPESVTHDARPGLVALGLSESEERIDTALVWRPDDESTVTAAFRDVARATFAGERSSS
jgi:DNA-binding transcriptional LysR family regulator